MWVVVECVPPAASVERRLSSARLRRQQLLRPGHGPCTDASVRNQTQVGRPVPDARRGRSEDAIPKSRRNPILRFLNWREEGWTVLARHHQTHQAQCNPTETEMFTDTTRREHERRSAYPNWSSRSSESIVVVDDSSMSVRTVLRSWELGQHRSVGGRSAAWRVREAPVPRQTHPASTVATEWDG